MKTKTLTLLPLAAAMSLALAGAVQADLTWYVNYQDSISALGYGTTTNPLSELTDKYKYTAESLVLFHDNDNSGGISEGDEYDDFVVYRVDQLFLGNVTNSDLDTFLKNAQISGTVIATGTQIGANDYTVDNADIEFWFDSPSDAAGTEALFDGPLGNFTDGVLVQTGNGKGGGTNSGVIPDGAIDIRFHLTDVLSGLAVGSKPFGPFEIFDPFVDLDDVVFMSDSNNQLCTAAICGSSATDLADFFGISLDDYDFYFHTQSDGSAIKAVPEPVSLALLGMGMIGFGFGATRRKRKTA